MRALLYRPSWQSLRVSFLQENRNDGGWTTPEGTFDNLTKLDNYVKGDGHFMLQVLNEARAMGYREEHEYVARLYRAINCLNAVRMGNSGQGRSGSDQDKLVLATRNDFQSRQKITYHEYLTYASTRWDWRVVKEELKSLYRDGHNDEFEQVERNLRKRQEKAITQNNRHELIMFLKLMDEVRAGG